MGFNQREAAKAVAAAVEASDRNGGDHDEAHLLRAAIQILGTGR